MTDHLPLGEEIWVRRDHRVHGGRFYFREPILYFCIIISTISTFMLIGIVYIVVNLPFMPWPLKLASIALLINMGLFSAKTYGSGLKSTSLCPVWFYAEQLNPERLRIYHFRKPPTIIKLAQSSLDKKIGPKKIGLKHYTTITITDKATSTSATLGLLTPEEYDRFMQYWNAAQKTHDE